MAVEIGVYLPQIGLGWPELRARVALCDRLGIDSVWFMDHLYPPGLPQVPSFEAWTTATAVAAVTERIRVGHLVLAAGFRHPALLAKMAITLDHVSGGRLALGLGSGSYAPEFAEFGVAFPPPRERAERLAETLEVVRRLFLEERASYDGRHYRLRAAPSLPRPLQRPHPPIHVGGAGERRTLPIVARYADVWNCPTYALGELPAKRAVLERECAAIGRDPREIRISLEAVLVLGADRARVAEALALAERRYPGPGFGLHEGGFIGTPAEIVDKMRASAAEGVSLFVFFTHDRAAPETLALLADEVLPAL
jgi:alkanesulfonate monooxygenase SsuD/methylene tetrahydromethanopterin reductase-like flavin-dependent oxidoreductase (luciferase family)